MLEVGRGGGFDETEGDSGAEGGSREEMEQVRRERGGRSLRRGGNEVMT